MITVTPATLDDIGLFFRDARSEDIEEIIVCTGKNFFSQPVYTLKDAQAIRHVPSGDLLGLAGVDRTGRIWMLLTNHIYNHRMEFLRFSKRGLEELLKNFPKLHNVTLRKNILHTKWLKWLGAKFEEDVEDPRFVKFIFKRKGVEAACATSVQSCRVP